MEKNIDIAQNLPVNMQDAVLKLTHGLMPSCLKALDRLIGAGMDVPIAWLKREAAKIDAQTKSYTLVEESIAKSVALEAGADKEIAQRAMHVLVRKEYRKQENREAVATAMLEDLSSKPEPERITDTSPAPEPTVIDDDWLNVFEHYAEDASSERMQKLWGRVLAGEIRKPNSFSLRTMRFLSEFSQEDGLTFSNFCESVFVNFAPKKLVKDDTTDISHLVNLESIGLIQGASGLGLCKKLNFNNLGDVLLIEGSIVIVLKSEPDSSFNHDVVVLTSLGMELKNLLPNRDIIANAKKVAFAMRSHEIKSAFLGKIVSGNRVKHDEILWYDNEPISVVSQSVAEA